MEVRPDGESNINYEMNKCIGIIQKGGVACVRNAHPDCGSFCKTHHKVYQRDNPTTRLTAVNNPLGVEMLRKLAESPDVLEKGMRTIYAARRVYSPSLDENKFIAGAVCEEVTTDMFREVGFAVENVASTERVIDIRVIATDGSPIGISLKNSGNISSPPILENYRAKTVTAIRPLPPTFIFYTEPDRARIVYLDHDILRKSCDDMSDEDFHKTVYKQNDSNLTFVSGFLKTLIPRLPSEYILSAHVPQLPALAPSNVTQLVLDHVRKVLHNAEMA